MIRYSKITHRNGTIYSATKGNTLERHGDTIFVKTEGFRRVVHIPWFAVDEADLVEDKGEKPC